MSTRKINRTAAAILLDVRNRYSITGKMLSDEMIAGKQSAWAHLPECQLATFSEWCAAMATAADFLDNPEFNRAWRPKAPNRK